MAKRRGILWALSFEQWLGIWGERLIDRGSGRNKLCMARNGDIGPYAIGNVKIITNGQNLSEGTWSKETKSKAHIKGRASYLRKVRSANS
jgi:hypothetical protein